MMTRWDKKAKQDLKSKMSKMRTTLKRKNK